MNKSLIALIGTLPTIEEIELEFEKNEALSRISDKKEDVVRRKKLD